MQKIELLNRAENLISLIENEKWAVHGLEIYKDSELIKSFGNTKDRFPVYSITKSLVSMAVGIAESEGLIKITESVADCLPETFINKLSPEKMRIFKELSIERLLTMSIKGLPFRPQGENWLKFISEFQFNLQRKGFCYSNICAYLVSVALENRLEKPLYDYLKQKLFMPLEIPDPPYTLSPEGYFNGASGVELSVEELSRIGKMMMNDGKYNSLEIVPESYLKKAVSIQIENREGGYGYFFWKFFDGFSLNGKWGQKCFCLPEQKIMISVLADMQNDSDKLKKEIASWFGACK